MLYKTKVAMIVRGDRIEKGVEIDLTPDEVAGFDPSDITALSEIVEPEPEPSLADKPIEEMTLADLKVRAKELGLSASGSKAEIEERIRLHLDGAPETEEELSEPNQ